MKRGILLTALVAATLLLSIGTAPVRGSDGDGLAMVQGKGTFLVTGVAVDVSIVAVKTPSGAVEGRVDHQWAKGDPYVPFGRTVSRVTCVRLSAFAPGRAAVGGVVVYSTTGPEWVGTEVLYSVDDRQSGAAGPLDGIIAGIGPGASTCPFDPGYIAGPWDDLVAGDFTIRTNSAS